MQENLSIKRQKSRSIQKPEQFTIQSFKNQSQHSSSFCSHDTKQYNSTRAWHICIKTNFCLVHKTIWLIGSNGLMSCCKSSSFKGQPQKCKNQKQIVKNRRKCFSCLNGSKSERRNMSPKLLFIIRPKLRFWQLSSSMMSHQMYYIK